jgi:hypothetical protein
LKNIVHKKKSTPALILSKVSFTKTARQSIAANVLVLCHLKLKFRYLEKAPKF